MCENKNKKIIKCDAEWKLLVLPAKLGAALAYYRRIQNNSDLRARLDNIRIYYIIKWKILFLLQNRGRAHV